MLWTAFTIGLFGSLHCVGMCGPIALAMPTGTSSPIHQLSRILLYNSGRILTYMLLGALIGSVGLGTVLAGWQSGISIGIGILLLIIVLWQVQVEYHLLRLPVLGRLHLWLHGKMGGYLKASSPRSHFSMGLINGLLPCGLVYLAILGAVTTPGPLQAMSYMALFGLGTLPLMVATVLMGRVATVPVRRLVTRLYPVFLMVLACWFILRGMQFELPAGFDFWAARQEAPMCH